VRRSYGCKISQNLNIDRYITYFYGDSKAGKAWVEIKTLAMASGPAAESMLSLWNSLLGHWDTRTLGH